MKTITTGTEITFTKTGEKFTLTQTDTGFDVKQVKLSKNVAAEPYSFQELMDLYEAGNITIAGFEETDDALIKSIITNYMHAAALKEKLTTIQNLEEKIEQLKAENKEITAKNEKLNTAIEALQD